MKTEKPKMKEKKQIVPDVLCMAEAYWANSPLSVVRHTGRIEFRGAKYIIVDKRGWDVFECSLEAERLGRDKAIEPGEPCDLIWEGLRPAYRALGRDRIMELLKDGNGFEEIEAVSKKEIVQREGGPNER